MQANNLPTLDLIGSALLSVSNEGSELISYLHYE